MRLDRRRERGVAMNRDGATIGMAVAIGPLVGGAPTHSLGGGRASISCHVGWFVRQGT
jgi:hypothetical protein